MQQNTSLHKQTASCLCLEGRTAAHHAVCM
jgi:hypothetical protein